MGSHDTPDSWCTSTNPSRVDAFSAPNLPPALRAPNRTLTEQSDDD